jgi:hypothetical protein
MTEEVLDPDRIVREVTRVAGNRIVEVDLALLDELHDERRRERLGLRRDVVDRVRGGGDAVLVIGVSESFRPQHLLILDDGGGQAGDAKARTEVLDLGLESSQPRFFARCLR